MLHSLLRSIPALFQSNQFLQHTNRNDHCTVYSSVCNARKACDCALTAQPGYQRRFSSAMWQVVSIAVHIADRTPRLRYHLGYCWRDRAKCCAPNVRAARWFSGVVQLVNYTTACSATGSVRQCAQIVSGSQLGRESAVAAQNLDLPDKRRKSSLLQQSNTCCCRYIYRTSTVMSSSVDQLCAMSIRSCYREMPTRIGAACMCNKCMHSFYTACCCMTLLTRVPLTLWQWPALHTLVHPEQYRPCHC